ncbi:hypothetical protein JX266_005921 [Neoarthrinium moseri]|nr:hypothetical protein JX266_005921 [Neoarthrinium moseri]
MRLYLLPISTRRTLLYCQKLDTPHLAKNKTLVDKATSKAAHLWTSWEKKESGWQKTVVNYGNAALRRIPYEEWGLKSVPPLSARRRDDELQGVDKIEVVYPETVIPTTKALGVLQTLATERQSLHRQRLIWCLIGMPISAPFALVPVIPNIPFFYLLYRAWSHWRALAGGKHVQFLASNSLLSLSPSPILKSIYPSLLPASSSSTQTPPSQPATNESGAPAANGEEEEERMVLSQANGRELFKALDIPELEVEIERAIEQVEVALRKEKKEKAEGAGKPKASTTTEAEEKKEK